MVVSQSILLFNTLKWLGAAYLIYLGAQSMLAKRHEIDTNHTPFRVACDDMATARAFWSSFLVSVLNPKFALFYLVLFTQVVRPGTPDGVQAVYGLTVLAMTFGWHALLALFASQTAVRARFQAAMHWVERVTGAVLIALGVRLAFSRASS